jgi:hypothetical protein
VQKVRVAANHSTTNNNLKQIQLAVQNFASMNGEKIPTHNGSLRGPNPEQSVFVAILPYLEQDAVYRAIIENPDMIPDQVPKMKLFLDPADPTLDLPPHLPYFNTVEPSAEWYAVILPLLKVGLSSYAANAQAFRDGITMNTVTDGQSNTIAFAMHYAAVCQQGYGAYFKYAQYDRFHGSGGRRATFADGGPFPRRGEHMTHYMDYYPVTTGNPPTAQAAHSGMHETIYSSTYTFQLAPNPTTGDCNRNAAQTPYQVGMPVVFLDGSVRCLSGSIAGPVFWGAVTPAGGEVLGDW